MSGRNKTDFDYKIYSDTGLKVEKIRKPKMAVSNDKENELKLMSTNIKRDLGRK